MTEECREYNSLKYRTMILTGSPLDVKTDSSEETINTFLKNDIENNKKGVWCKLSRTEKHRRITDFVDKTLSPLYALDETEKITALKFCIMLVDTRKLSKTNDISYNKEDRVIERISGLVFNPISRKFMISLEKQKSTKKNKKDTKKTKEKDTNDSNANANDSNANANDSNANANDSNEDSPDTGKDIID